MDIRKCKKCADAVFEGGGVKGIGLVGAIKAFEDDGYEWKNIAGTSAGSIIAALLAVGCNAEEIKTAMLQLDYKKITDKNPFSIPLLSNIFNLLFKKGIFKGDYLENWIDKFLSRKLKFTNGRKVTFGDLIVPGEKGILLNNEKYKRKYKLHIIATDISNGKMLILPEDIVEYGIDPDDLEVSLAIRMSISIPYFFQPKTLNYVKENKKSLIIDGGVLSNYPVWLFDSNGTPRWPTIGFKLSGNKKIGDHKITNIINFTSSIIETMLETQDDIHIGETDYLRTVKIDTLDVKTTEFNISNKKVIDLYNSGEICAIKFLEKWDNNYRKHKVLRGNTFARRR